MNDRATLFLYTMPLVVTAACIGLFIIHGWYLAYRRRNRERQQTVGGLHVQELKAAMPAIFNVGGAILVILLLLGAALSAYA